MNSSIVLIIASFFGATAIILGAFGAHALKKHFTSDLMQSFETGVKYQMYHALVLLIIGFNYSQNVSLLTVAIWLFVAGTVLFSFSIYGLCLSSAFGNKMKWLGPITPLGGLCLLTGWIMLGIAFV
ncbi:DUF423 domain-containing protein [Flavobacteriaceae bacterium M23B6Z8]